MSVTAFQALGFVIQLMTFLLAGAAFARAARWKESDDAKQLHKDMHSLTQSSTELGRRIGQLEKDRATAKDLDHRLTRLEAKHDALATKEDMAELKGTFGGLKDLVIRAEAAVERVELYLMERGK